MGLHQRVRNKAVTTRVLSNSRNRRKTVGDEKKEEGTKEIRNKTATLLDKIAGQADEHGQKINPDGSPVKEEVPDK